MNIAPLPAIEDRPCIALGANAHFESALAFLASSEPR